MPSKQRLRYKISFPSEKKLLIEVVSRTLNDQRGLLVFAYSKKLLTPEVRRSLIDVITKRRTRPSKFAVNKLKLKIVVWPVLA
jgi:hypothetical protein